MFGFLFIKIIAELFSDFTCKLLSNLVSLCLMLDFIDDTSVGLSLSDSCSDLSLEVSPIGSVTVVSWLIFVPKFEVRNLRDTLISGSVRILFNVNLESDDTGVVLLEKLPSF